MSDVAEIAGKLHDRFGKLVIVNRGIAYGNCPYDASVMNPLVKAGLFSRSFAQGFRARYFLTPLGEAVRAHLANDRREG